MTAKASSRMVVAPDVCVREFDGEIVVLQLARGVYYGLDGVGVQLWSSLVAGRSIEEAAREIARSYDVTYERLLSDLLDLTTDLIACGLLEVAGGVAP